MQRLTRVGAGTGFICVIFAMLATLGMSARFLPDLRAGGLINPDSYMRLVRLRAMLDGGTEVYSVARDGSGHGTLLHWSHLIDSLLYLLALPFSLVMGQDNALHAASLIFGPLCIGALGYAVVWAAVPFAERKWLFLGAILPPMSPAIISYGAVGVVHHHVPIVIVAVACFGWVARLIAGCARPSAPIALGSWAGLGIWLTPETVPLSMMAFGALFVAWIVSSEGREAADALPRAIGLTGLAFALATLLALLVDPPAAGIAAAEIDRVSIVFAGLALAVAATGAGVWALAGSPWWRGVTRVADGERVPETDDIPTMDGMAGRGRDLAGSTWVRRTTWIARAAAGCAIGLVFCGVWAAVFWHAIFHTGMAEGEARLNTMFNHISEMLPVVGIFQDLHFLLTGLLALLAVTVLALRRRSVILAYAATCLVVLLLLGSAHVRFSAYPEAAGAIALPIALTLTGAATAAWHQIGQSFTRLAIIMLFIQVPYLGQLPDVTATARAAAMIEPPACKAADAIALLAPYPGAVVLADVNDTPEILYKTGLRTVRSLYHRNVDAFLRLRAAWRSAPSRTVPPEIDAAEISLVLGCGSQARSPLVSDLKTETLFDQVSTARPPPWLKQIAENKASGHVLYQVVRPDGAAGQTSGGNQFVINGAR
jgi:hypothetical protein